MRLLHVLARTHASFDDPNLVSRAGLVPVMALAQRAGLAGLAGENVRIARRCGANAQLKVPCLVADLAAAEARALDRVAAGMVRIDTDGLSLDPPVNIG